MRGKLVLQKLISFMMLLLAQIILLYSIPIGMKEGLQEVSDLIILDMDSKQLFEALTCGEGRISQQLRSILQQVKQEKKKLITMKVSLVNQCANACAKSITVKSKQGYDLRYLASCIPNDLKKCLTREVEVSASVSCLVRGEVYLNDAFRISCLFLW